jgi:hypothetical protein
MHAIGAGRPRIGIGLALLTAALAAAPAKAVDDAALSSAFSEARFALTSARTLAPSAALKAPPAAAAAPEIDTLLTAADLAARGGDPLHHASHFAIFDKYTGDADYNGYVLQAIDKVQGTAPKGGGYFANNKAVPAESPIGYALKLFGQALFAPFERTTSFCTGASYAVFIEALNLINAADPIPALDAARADAMRMQEADGSRRPDGSKFWGHWNGNSPGISTAMTRYSDVGEVVPDWNRARPGDFIDIDWKGTHAHTAIFLGWYVSKGRKSMLIWSSQESSNGLGDYLIPISRIAKVEIVRLVDPDALTKFDPSSVIYDPQWGLIRWSVPRPRHRRRRRAS